MDFDVKNMEAFWENRFHKEGAVWGDNPSKSAVHALDLFSKNGVNKILVPGSGYGRNSRLFNASGFSVTGYEISQTACAMAEKFDPKTRLFQGSVLDMSRESDVYDAVYCFNVLHLFHENERKLFIRECARKLRNHGYLYFVVFSEKERGFGKGDELEKNTFEVRAGRPTHFFTDGDMREHFQDFRIIETNIIEDPEVHKGEGPHTHILRYLLAVKMG
ncbi:MAG: class I SAM-dependent methyltransferase [Chloroflexota bacterium]